MVSVLGRTVRPFTSTSTFCGSRAVQGALGLGEKEEEEEEREVEEEESRKETEEKTQRKEVNLISFLLCSSTYFW
ncbi:hypothetical protein CMV_030698 [Castanea mollissima]|uniref:Uncharacterized protein n=1 Tax=Castanea mollissima TaxID=60419 RepID=A0A8J4Q5P8_9ROSI|nr:hypothetical protein CMV_030698 [Castanea mollissima]